MFWLARFIMLSPPPHVPIHSVPFPSEASADTLLWGSEELSVVKCVKPVSPTAFRFRPPSTVPTQSVPLASAYMAFTGLGDIDDDCNEECT